MLPTWNSSPGREVVLGDQSAAHACPGLAAAVRQESFSVEIFEGAVGSRHRWVVDPDVRGVGSADDEFHAPGLGENLALVGAGDNQQVRRHQSPFACRGNKEDRGK